MHDNKKFARTFLPEIIAPGTGLSPLTDKSKIPANNVPTVEDVLKGKTYKLPGGGGDWSFNRGEDGFKSFHEYGPDYKRKERELDILNKVNLTDIKQDEWVVKVPGGKKIFNSFEALLEYQRKMKEKGQNVNWISRMKTAQNNSVPEKVSKAMKSTFMVESTNVFENYLEIGECFCVSTNYFVTCAHVVKKYNKNTDSYIDVNEVNSKIKINIVVDNIRKPANLVAIDAARDIAILMCDIDCPFFTLDINNLVGEEIFAIGSPHGFENNVSFGHIGSLNKKIYSHANAPDYMFLDLSVFSGNSGGPIVKVSNGHVVCIVTAIVSKNGDYGLNAGLSSNHIVDFCNKNNINIDVV